MTSKRPTTTFEQLLGLRFTTSTVMAGAAEILAYGTGVVIEPDDAPQTKG